MVVSIDVRADEEIATRGWTMNSGRYLEEALIEMSSAGVAVFSSGGAEVILAKHRNGPTGIVSLLFRKELTQFSNLAKTEVDYAGY